MRGGTDVPRRNKYILIGAAVAVVLVVGVIWAVSGLTGNRSSDADRETGDPGASAGTVQNQLQTETGGGVPTSEPMASQDPSEPSSAPSEPSTEPSEPSTVPPVTEPTQTEPQATAPATTAPTDPQEIPEPTFPVLEDKLEILGYGRYSGEYVEDGSDEPVSYVAAILVRNNTSEYLDYAQIVMDIGGKAARFVVMGLPPGESAWVLEKSRMEIAADAQFLYADSAIGYKPSVDPDTLPVSIVGDRGQITLTNTGSRTLPEVYVYYKIRHKDGNFLGGILYRKSFGDLEPGQTRSELAGHFDPDKAEIVRITWNEET